MRRHDDLCVTARAARAKGSIGVRRVSLQVDIVSRAGAALGQG